MSYHIIQRLWCCKIEIQHHYISTFVILTLHKVTSAAYTLFDKQESIAPVLGLQMRYLITSLKLREVKVGGQKKSDMLGSRLRFACICA